MMLMLMALVGMTACDKEESSVDDPVQDEIDPALLEQTAPEFSKSDFEAENLFVWTTSTNGTWTIAKLNGIVGNINYGLEPSPEPPKTAEDFFKDNLPMTADDEMRKDGGNDSWTYRQYYKGILVERGKWEFHFNGVISRNLQRGKTSASICQSWSSPLRRNWSRDLCISTSMTPGIITMYM